MPDWVETNVPMHPDPLAPSIAGWNPFYADTEETPWFAYGTQSVGARLGRIDIGNPWFVQFVFDVDETIPTLTPVFVSVLDGCIPEPLTLAMLGVAGLLLFRRRKA